MENCVAPGLDEFDVIIRVVLSLVRVSQLLIIPRTVFRQTGHSVGHCLRLDLMIFCIDLLKAFCSDEVSWFFIRFRGLLQWICQQLLFSSPEPSGSQGELIVYPYSGVRCRRCRRRRRQQCLNIFSSETALPIKAKFYVESPWEGGTKVYINGPGHMTKMAAMPIYGKNL